MKNKNFEYNEEKALKEAFSRTILRGKPFNIIAWKKKREKERIKLI